MTDPKMPEPVYSVFVRGNRQETTPYAPAWALRDGVDAQKPKAKTPSERYIKYKRKKETQPLKPAPKIIGAPSSVFQLASFQ